MIGTHFRSRRPHIYNGQPCDSPHSWSSECAYQGLDTPYALVASGRLPNADIQTFPLLYLEYVNNRWPYRLDGPWTAVLKPSKTVLSSCSLTLSDWSMSVVPLRHEGDGLPRSWNPLGGKVPAAMFDGSAGMKTYRGGPSNTIAYIYANWDRDFEKWNAR